MLIREFRVPIIVCVNVVCDEDTPLDVARAKAGQDIDELRKILPCENWVDGFPKKIEEIIKEQN